MILFTAVKTSIHSGPVGVGAGAGPAARSSVMNTGVIFASGHVTDEIFSTVPFHVSLHCITAACHGIGAACAAVPACRKKFSII